MKSKKFLNWAFIALMCGAVTACSDDDDNKDIDNQGQGGSSSLVFDGNVIGNGDQEFVFSGKETLAQGTYLLKGWVYIADGAELTIEPGTIIKGDKQTKAALIVEPGGYVEMKGTKEAPIVMTSEEAPGNSMHRVLPTNPSSSPRKRPRATVVPATGADSSSAVTPATTRARCKSKVAPVPNTAAATMPTTRVSSAMCA